MTAKILKQQSFSAATNYVYKEGHSEVIDYSGVMITDPLSAAASFNAQAKLRPDIKSPVGHICISFHPDDTSILTNDLMIQLCKEWMTGMGISDTQYLLMRHLDTLHQHMHLVYNRIDNNGSLISDKFWYRKNEKVCKDIKKKYGLTFSPGKQNININRLHSGERVRHQMYLDVKTALDKASGWFDFNKRLSEMGIDLNVKHYKGTHKAYGVAFSRDGYSIKGSKLDKSLSYAKLDKVLWDRFVKEQVNQTEKKSEKQAESESHSQSRAKEIAASLFEGNLGTSQEQDIKDTPKKKKGKGRSR